ncbi:hypothetical protein O3M35_003170 [Rhynocoris fuscipes]|uniref:Condensin-2 complex subunit H2 C-terminal domain-containing protein n=1 Tax=Rhynocoris fuscipes TaxID=488301 RepID=A0AAW1CM36_9HEMI
MAGVTDNFEVLLHPPSKNFASDWQRPINRYLEDYLQHCCALQNINFSEAAIILANISDIYKKRIDLLYNEFLNFISYMNDVEARKQETETAQNQRITKKPKRGLNTFQNEPTDILKIIDNEHCTSVNLDNINKTGEKKKVILNHFMKVPIKLGTGCQVYDAVGMELGYKDEFRLFWPISSEGLASEYFDYRNQNLERISGQLLEDSNDCNDDCVMNHNGSFDDSMEVGMVEQQPSINEPIETNPVQPDSPSSPPPLSPKECTKNKKIKTKKVVDIWETICFNFVFPLRVLAVKNVFSLPKYLKEEGSNEKMKRKRNGEIKENYNDKCTTVAELFYQHEILSDSVGLKLKSKFAEKHRKELILSALKTEIKNDDQDEVNNYHAEDDNVYDDDDDYHHDGDFEIPFEGENDSGPVDMAADKDYVENATNYLNTAVEVLTDYKKNKKVMSEKRNEIAKKVVQWHKSIMPALEAAETRSIFDVHEYGTKVLNHFAVNNDKEKNILQFRQLVNNQPKEEIGRFLLASLTLANTNNVEIIKSNKQELAKDCIELRLLSKVRHQDVLNKNMEVTTADSRS